MKLVNFKIEIGELVLHDFERVDGAEVGASLRAELGTLLAHRGWPDGRVEAAALTELAGGSFYLTADADAGSIGRHLAQHVYRGMIGAAGEVAGAASAPPQGAAGAAADQGGVS